MNKAEMAAHLALAREWLGELADQLGDEHPSVQAMREVFPVATSHRQVPMFDPGTPHAVIVEWLREAVWQPYGVTCPTCEQHAEVYRRRINVGMAQSLLKMYEHDPYGWMHIPTVVGRKSSEEGKLTYWGLIEEELDRRPDGGRAGYWRLTALGRRFARGEVSLPKYAWVYDGRCLGLDSTSSANIHDALGAAFDYTHLRQQKGVTA